MKQIITHTPLYVWPLLALLIWGGWKSRKTYIVSLRGLLPLPAIMLIWSIYANLSRIGLFWLSSLSVGMLLGSWMVGHLCIKFDKERHLLEIEGNWMTMVLSLSLFGLRYFLGAMQGMHPEWTGSDTLWIVENLATLISGILLGRLIGYWRLSRSRPSIDLQ